MVKVTLNFSDVKFHIKEFQKVYILGGCYLAFYLPQERHLEAKESEEDIIIKKRKKKGSKKGSEEQTFLVDSNQQHIKKIDIDKSKSQRYIQEKNQEKEKRIAKLGLNADNIDSEFDALGDEAMPSHKRSRNDYKDYDVFYDVYTNQNNIENYIEKIKVKDGIAEVEAKFLQDFFKKSREGKENHKWCIIPRLIPENETMDKFEFDPVPLEDKGFVITDFHNAKQRTLTFQRRIAEVKNPDLTLQTPKEFLESLSPSKEFDENKDKLAQAKATQKACELRVSEMEKILGKKMSKEEVEERIKELSKRRKTKEERNELTRLEFLQMNKNKAERYGGIVKNLGKNQRHKPIYSKDIGDTGECLASLLFDKKSTRYLSNQRKLDANFNTKGFNHTIPDFLVTLNDYPTLIEVKNVQVQSLTEQISFELKLAREYELDYVFLCNHYTKLTDNIAGEVLSKREHEELAQDKEGVKAFNEETQRTLNDLKKKIKNQKKENQDWSEYDKLKTSRLRVFSEEGGDRDARSGFIYHRHLHRSIKTIFKEIYLHHIKGAAPNKIIIKRLNLNDATQIEEELNKDQNLQNG